MQIGQVFAARYRLDERLGAGAFGEVYAAFDQGLLQRRVAIKLLKQGEGGGEPSEAQAERFIAELRLAGALRHPHIAAVHDAGVWQGQLYMVQELVDGVDLGRFLEQNGPLSLDFALSLAADMLDAVATAHATGVVHRDLKPGNLLVDAQHRIVVVDFGLATSTGGPAGEPRGSTSGTPGYAAPEQIRGGGDARADQFSAAAVLYLMLTGVAPFVGKNLPETLRRTLLMDPEPPSRLRPDLPVGLDRILARALRKDPAERYPDLATMAAELAAYADFGALASAGERRAALAEAVASGGLVVVTDGDAEGWIRALGLSLAVTLGEARPPDDPGLRLLTDPREEIYPSPAAPVVLRLRSDDSGLTDAHDGLRAALVTSAVLAVGLSPDQVGLRRLLQTLRAWGADPRRAFAVAPRWSLDEVRAAERRGLWLLEGDPVALRADLAAELPPAPAADRRPLPARPYKFLSYFDDADEGIFFGRDMEIERLHARVLAWPVSLLYGASGAGKTSLVRAALAPRLRRAGHRVLLTRVFDDPLAEICRAAGLPLDPPEGRAAALASCARQGRLLVVVLDQLEELFVRFPRPAREAVAAALSEALAQSGGHLRLVLCLRADYLARLAELHGLLPLSLERGLYLEALSSLQARQAVERPAALLGLGVEPALIEQMIEDLSVDGVDPPQLQLVCDALWDALPPGERALTLGAYRALGEARSVLARHLQRALGDLPGPEQDTARAVLKAMVTAHDTRSVRRLADIARVAELPVPVAGQQLDALARLRLVRPLERLDGVWYELTHEVLASEIGRWLSAEDRRVQQVRELLEQGVRGYDQLGLVLSRAQLDLVAPFENRLNLNEKERALIARSRAVEAHGRRRFVGGVLLAAALLAAGVVGGRALWLSQQRFARASEGHLSWFRWGEPVEQPTSPITVWRGAVDPWAVDAWLGYPRDPYETDWTLDDLEPAARDLLRAGSSVSGDPELWLSARLSPLAATRRRFVAGELEGGADQIRAVAESPALGPEAALTLAPVLALGSPDPDVLLDPLLEVAGRRAASLRVPGGDVRLDGRVGGPMGLLLARTGPARWAAAVDGLQSDVGGAELASDLLAVAAPPEALGRLRPQLAASRPANVEGALRAVAASGDCAAQASARAVVSGPSRAASMDRALPSYLQLSASCGGPEDVVVIEDMLAGMARGELDLSWANDLLRTLYRLDRGAAADALSRYEPLLHARRETTVSPWAWVGDRDMIDRLTPGSAPQIHARLYLGDVSAVGPALAFGLGDRGDPGRAAWLWPLVLYRGDALAARVRELLGQSGWPVATQLPLIVAAIQAGDEASVRAAASALASPDRLPLEIALNQLASLPGPLPAGLGGAGRQASLARGVLALRRGEPTEVDFIAALRDPGATGLELDLAVEGQRRRWLAGPVVEALHGLRDPSARVRLAATLALAQRADPLPEPRAGRPWEAASLRRVAWARRALAFDADLRREARAALEAGNPLRAQQLMRLSRRDDGVRATFEAVLSPQLPGVFPVEIEAEDIYLNMLADILSGIGASTEWMITYIPPDLWGRYASDPLLADRRDLPYLRVLSGRSAPVHLDAL